MLRRLGNRIHSVVTHFDARALNEISFRRDRVRSLSVDEFDVQYEKVREHTVRGETEGTVQSEAEAELIARLETDVHSLLAGLEAGEILLVENAQGVDYPKMKDRKDNVLADGENRLYFRWRVDPPLRLGLYQPRRR